MGLTRCHKRQYLYIISRNDARALESMELARYKSEYY